MRRRRPWGRRRLARVGGGFWVHGGLANQSVARGCCGGVEFGDRPRALTVTVYCGHHRPPIRDIGVPLQSPSPPPSPSLPSPSPPRSV